MDELVSPPETTPAPAEPEGLVDEPALPRVNLPQAHDPSLLSDPMDPKKGPTAFQRKEINWSDGGPDPNAPKAFDVPETDFLEVDYQYGRKKGASDDPVLAANVFGRQFTAEELSRDEEGRRLLDLMAVRRRGDANKGGTFANFGRGWANWSASDIPFYGWVSDIGATAGEAIDISKTMRKLQNGEKVDPHEAIQARRYMLQQEIESTRTTAYNVGQITRQMVPFMAEMAVTSFVGAQIGAVVGPIGAGIGGVAGAIIGASKWLLTGGRVATRAGTRYIANKGMKVLAEKAVKDITKAEIAQITRTGAEMYGREGLKAAVKEISAGVAKSGMSNREVHAEVARRLAGQLATQIVDNNRAVGSMAVRGLLNADSQIAISTGVKRAGENFLLSKAGVTDASKLTLREYKAKLAEGIRNIGGFSSDEWKAFRKSLADGVVKGMNGTKIDSSFVRGAMKETTGQFITPKFADAATKVIFDDAIRTLELQHGSLGFLSGPTRFARYLGEHVVRGLIQSEHAMIRGGAPTMAHSGMSAFFHSADALKEGLGRVFVEAPVTAAVQLGLSQPITAPLFALAFGHGAGDAVFKGQLGFQAAALMRGDRDAMESARMCAIGSMFAEYASENAGRGLGIMLGGAAGTLARKTVPQMTAGASAAKAALVNSRFTREAGDALRKMVDTVYGTGDLQKIGTEKLVGLAMSRTAKWAGRSLPESDIRNALVTKSLEGTSQAFRDLLASKGIRNASGFRKAVIAETQELNRFGVIRACFGAELLRRGLSPDEIVRKFRQMGYGGVLEEMGEERVGDFVRGVMGWDDSASDETVSERLANAFSGFADPEQLMTEMIGFAIPGAIRSFTIASQKWMMNGGLAQTREATTRLKNLDRAASSRPVVVHEAVNADHATALDEHVRHVESLRDKALGASGENRAAVEAAAANAMSRVDGIRASVEEERNRKDEEGNPVPQSAESAIAEGRLAPVLAAKDEQHMRRQLVEFADSFMDADTPEQLEAALEASHAEELLGEDGVNAVRREWRKVEGHSFSSDHPVEASLADYENARKNPPKLDDFLPKNASDAAKSLYVNSPVLGGNSSQTAEEEETARQGSNLADVSVNEDVLNAGVDDLSSVCRTMGRAAFLAGEEGGRGRRFLSRFIGMLGAIGTGELGLVANNPAAWIMQDKSLDPMLMNEGLAAYSASLLEGYRRIRAQMDAKVRETLDRSIDDGTFLAKVREMKLDVPTVEQMENAGADRYREVLTDVMRSYLVGCGTMVMTREAADDAALKVVAARHRRGNEYVVDDADGETVRSYSDPRFRARWESEIAAAHNEVVDELVRVASSAMGYNSHPTLGSSRQVVTVDVARAIRNGTKEEVLAAILSSPAFQGVSTAVNISGHTELEKEIGFSSATAQEADLGAVLAIDVDDPSREITEAELASVSRLLHIDTSKSDKENQAAVRHMVRAIRLAVESTAIEYEDNDGGTRRAVILPANGGPSGRSYVARVIENGRATDTPAATFDEARRALADQGFTMREKKIVVSSLRDFVSSDATSVVIFRSGNDQEMARAAFLRAMGVSEDDRVPVREEMLPPFLRKMEVNENGTVSRRFVYDTATDVNAAAKAAVAFREELALAKEGREFGENVSLYLRGTEATVEQRAERMQQALSARNRVFGSRSDTGSFAGYESLAEKMLLQAGIRRNDSPAVAANLNAMGVTSDAWVMPVSAINTRDAVVLAPDYATDGHGEALLRMGIRNAVTSYLVDDADLADKRGILGDAVRAFRRAGEELAAELETRHPDKAKRIRAALASTIRETADGVTADSVAAIASSSVFFSCERAIRGTGNGFLYSPELARIADRFRNDPIYPFFVSALDEAAGGIGLFHLSRDSKGETVSSAGGLARFLDVFSSDSAAIADGRRSAVFSDSDSETVVAPFMPEITLRKGVTADVLNSGGSCMEVATDRRDDRFDGNVKGGYMVRLSAMCQRFTTQFFSKAGGTRTFLTAAEAYRLARSSDILGGETKTAPKAATSGSKEAFAGSRAGVDRALRNVLAPELVSGIDAKTSRAFGNALRMMADTLGITRGVKETAFRAEILDYLLNQAVPADIAADVIESFDHTIIAEREIPDVQAEKDEVQAEDDEAMAEGRSADDVWGVRREAMFADSDDVSAISKVVRWVFPALGGSIAHTMQEFKNEIFRYGALDDAALATVDGVLSDADAARVRTNVAQFLSALNPYADIGAMTDAYARSPWYPRMLADGRKETKRQTWARVDGILDDVIRALALNRRYDLALVVQSIRNVPTENGRRVKFLEMLTHLAPCEAEGVTLRTTYDAEGNRTDSKFVLDRLGSVVESDRTPRTVQSSYSMVLESPLLSAAVRKGDPDAIAGTLGTLLFDIRRAGRPAIAPAGVKVEKSAVDRAYSLVHTVAADSLTKLREQGWPLVQASAKVAVPVLCGNSPAEASELYAKLTDRSGQTSYEDFLEALDRVIEIVRERAAKCADALDVLLGRGSHLARVFRNAETFARLRRHAVESYDTPRNRPELNLVLRLCNYFTACPGVTNKQHGTWQVWRTSQAIADLFEEPVEAIARRIGVEDAAYGAKSADYSLAAKYAAQFRAGVSDGFSAKVRPFLQQIALAKARFGTHFDNGLTHVESLAKQGVKDFNPADPVQRPVVSALLDHYIAAGAQSARTMGGRAANLTQLAKERAVTTLPCMLPALARACASDLFRIGGAAKELQENGMLWADGSRPIVSIVGAKDENGSLFDKAALAGILRKALLREQEDQRKLDRYVFPLFRGDKPSCFAIQVPARIVREWVAAYADSEKALEQLRAVLKIPAGREVPQEVFSAPKEGEKPKYDVTGKEDLVKAAKLASTLPAHVRELVSRVIPRELNVWYGSGENARFSNLALRPFVDKLGRRYESVEHAYQTLKSGGFAKDIYEDPGWKKAGHSNKKGPAANRETNVALMRKLVLESFRQNPEEAAALVATGNAEFTHVQDNGVWKTEFPAALKAAREELSGASENPTVLYAAAEALVANANGQMQIDAKRVQVTMSVGVPISLYAANDAGEVEPDAGFYVVSTFGGRTGTQSTGSYFLHGCAVDRVTELSEGNTSVAEKLHIFGLQQNVNLKKGQGFAFGLGCDEEDNDEHCTLASYREHQRVLRREVEDAMGQRLKSDVKLIEGMEGILDPVPAKPDGMADDEYGAVVKAHRKAVDLAAAFCTRSTFMSDDYETNKAGTFGSRCGFSSDDLGKLGVREISVSITRAKPAPAAEETSGRKARRARQKAPAAEPEMETRTVQLYVRGEDGKWKAGADLKNWDIDTLDEAKNGQIPLAYVLGAAAASLETDLSSADVGQIEAWFRTPDGRDVRAKLSDILSKGDRISVRWDAKNRAARLRYFTRSMIAQIVANNSNSSRPSDHHTFPTNTTRDEEVLEMITNAWTGALGTPSESTRFTDAHLGFSMLQLAQLGHVGRNNSSIVRNAVLSDPEIVAMLETHPNDNGLADAISSKVKALYAKQALVNFCGTHGVMSPSAANGHVLVDDSRFDHCAALDEPVGTTEYDRDALRPATVYTSVLRDFMRQDRSYASGLVNTTEPSFRYGWYMDEAAFDANVAKLFDEDDAISARADAFFGLMKSAGRVPRGKGAKGRKQAEAGARHAARRMAVLEACLYAAKGWKAPADAKGAEAANPFRAALLSSFRDYTGRFAADGWNARTVSIDDLFRPDGTLDLAAIDFLDMRQSPDADGVPGQKCVFIGGSFFIAHRSPSGNIEAYSGVARASAPVSWSKRQRAYGRPGRESIYTLDPITMYTQGSDTDGDSAGVQVRKGGVPAIDGAALKRFIDEVRALPSDGGWDAERIWDIAKRLGFTEETAEAETIRGDVMDSVTRLLFDAQVENYRNMPVFHQGFLGTKAGENREMAEGIRKARVGNRLSEYVSAEDGIDSAEAAPSGFLLFADDVFTGHEIADWYAENPPSGGRRLYDLGFAGRQPVGTNAVFEEPITAATRARIADALDSSVPKAVRDLVVEGAQMGKVLKAAVNLVAGKGDTSVADASTAASAADAVSDSAGARGKSVFHQSRFVRAFARQFGFTEMALVASDGYSPVIDFDGHVDGVSNNLFDTAKEMFATRAGWTKAMLPYFLGQCAYDACKSAQKGGRIDSAFFLAEAINFLCAVTASERDAKSKGWKYNLRTAIGRVAYFTDPVEGRRNAVDQAVACDILKPTKDDAMLPFDDIVREFAEQSGLARLDAEGAKAAGLPSRWSEMSAEARVVVMASRMTAINAEKFGPYREAMQKVKALRASLDKARNDASKRRKISDEIKAVMSAVKNPYFRKGDSAEAAWTYVADQVLAPIKAYGDRVDYVIRAGWTPANYRRKQRAVNDAVGRWQNGTNAVGATQEAVGVTMNGAVAGRTGGSDRYDEVLQETLSRARDGILPDALAEDYEYTDGKSVKKGNPLRDLLFRKPRANRDGTLSYYTNSRNVARGVDLRDNQDRMVHVLGLVTGEGSAELWDFVGSFEGDGDFAGPTTSSFVTGFTQAVRYVSQDYASGAARARAKAEGFDTESATYRAIERFLSSLTVTANNEIGCTASFGSADLALLKDGFLRLSGSNGTVRTGAGSRTNGRTFVKALMLYAGITRPYGATIDYQGKSSLPAVFDDAAVARLESLRPIIVNDPAINLLTAVKPVKVETRGRVPVSAYDIVKARRAIETATRNLSRKLLDHEKTPEGEFMRNLRDDARNPRSRPVNEVVNANGDAFRTVRREAEVQATTGATYTDGVPDCYGRAMTTRTEFGRRTKTGFLTRRDFAVPYLDKAGRIAFRRGRATQRCATVEEAYNEILNLRIARMMENQVRVREAERFFDKNGFGQVNAKPSQKVSDLKAILRDAVTHSRPMHEALLASRDVPVLCRDAELTEALNAVIGEVAAGRLEPVEVSEKAAFAGIEAGDTRGGARGVTRGDFVDRIREVFPAGDFTREQALRNVPDAIRAAFTAAYGADRVEVTTVKDAEGNDTGLVKIVRDTGNGKVTTYVSTGDALGFGADDLNQVNSVLSTLNEQRVAQGLRPIDIEGLKRLSGGNRKFAALIAMSRLAGRNLGSSAGATAEFAPFMSGIIRLDHRADFAVLFHEYYHQMVHCFRTAGIVDSGMLDRVEAAFRTEEEAADAYSAYITGRTKAQYDGHTLLKDYGVDDTGVEEAFDHMRLACAALTAAAYRGDDASGVPTFALLVLSPKRPLRYATKEEIGRVESVFLGQEGQFSLPVAVSAEDRMDCIDLWTAVWDGLVNDRDVSATVARGEAILGRPSDRPVPPENSVEAKPAAEGERDVVDSVSKFLRKAVSRYRNQESDAGLRLQLKQYHITEISNGWMADPGLAPMIHTIRALLRQVAIAEGFEIEDLRTGQLTETGRRLLTDENAALLAMRLLHEDSQARQLLRDPNNSESWAGRASATYSAARALEFVSPMCYGTRSRQLAEKSAEMFRHLGDAVSARADRERDPEQAGFLRQQADQYYETARLVVIYADAVARGKDVHYLIDAHQTNSGNPVGLLVAILTGGASFYENRGWGWRGMKDVAPETGRKMSYSETGVQRYAPGSSALAITEQDPLTALAFDYAAQALYGAIEARSYEEQVHGFSKSDEHRKEFGRLVMKARNGLGTERTEKVSKEESAEIAADIAQGLGEIDPSLTREQVRPDVPESWYSKVDTRVTTPDFILANTGMWLRGDMQRTLGGIGLRDMMTDHAIRSVTESAYRLAADFSMFFGLDTVANDGVREISFDTSRLGRDAKGDFAVSEDYAHTVTNYATTRGYLFGIFNLGEKRVGRPMTAEDVRDLGLAGQLVRHIAGRDRNYITGIRVRDLAYQQECVARLEDPAVMEVLSPAAVLRRYARRSTAPGEGFTALDALLVRILEDVPMTVVKGSSRDRTSYEAIDSVEKLPVDSYYREIVSTLVDAVAWAKEQGTKRTSDDGFNWDEEPVAPETGETPNLSTLMAKYMVEQGRAARGKKGDVYLSIPVQYLVRMWDQSEAKAKLAEANRPEKMLNLYYWANRFGKELARINDAASRSSYLANGAGSNISLAGKRFFWWHGGSGAHARNVHKYRAAVELFRGLEVSGDDRLERVQNGVFGRIEALGPGELRKTAFHANGSFELPVQQLMFLASAVGAKDEAGTGRRFNSNDFAADVANGRYENDPRCAIPRNATVLDTTLLVNRLVSERNFADIEAAGDLPAPERQALLDMRTVCDRLSVRLREEVPGTVTAMSDEANFRHGTGELGDARTASESLIQMCRDLVTAERFRGCLAQMLTSVDADGTPAFIVDPTDQMASVHGMPDEYWAALAMHVAEKASGKLKSVVKYDAGLTGVENMHRIYRAIAESDDAKSYAPIDLGYLNATQMFRGVLCRKSDTDANGNVNPLTKAQGGEAACYMKQLLSTLNAPTTNAAWRVLDTVSSWSKIASVGFSAFFQIATVFESPTAAVGFWHTFLGSSRTGAKIGRKLGKAMRRAGGTGAFQGDAVFMRDLVDLINSDDPILTEARELCDLMGMPLDAAVPFVADENDSNPVLGAAGTVQRQCKALSDMAGRYMGAGAAKRVRKSLDFLYRHPTDYTFNVVLNGVKMAVVMQTMRRLREECLRGARPFDPVRELRRYATYINAEIGGVDPGRYAWATPQMRRILANSMFSWQWTEGAWEAGGGTAVTDILFGGHGSTPESRQWAFVRWLRMLGIVKFGVPVFLQAAIKALSLALMHVLPPDPDDEEGQELAKEVDDLPWLCIFNESKAGALAFDVTPLLKLARRIPGAAALKAADVPVISSLIPAYVGGGRNTTGKRRYYMHFGKQSDEFFRWFEDPLSQALAKTSIPMQKVLEGVFGQLNPQGYRKAFADKSLAERWLNFDITNPDESAFANLVWSMTSFSAQSVAANPDAGFFAAVGPMRMGQSKRSTRLRIVERLKEFAEDRGHNDPWSYRGNRRRLNLLCTDILREAQLNGVDPKAIVTSAIGDVTKGEYAKLMGALPKDIRTNEFDVPALREAVIALTRMNRKTSDILNSIVEKYEAAGTDVKRNPAFRQAVWAVIRATQAAPSLFGNEEAQRTLDAYLSDPEKVIRSTQLDDNGGEAFSNFLATDEVPETLFGVPVVTRDYTEEDIEFFRIHPEAGGFYETGDDGDVPEPPDGSDGATRGGRSRKAKGRFLDSAVPKVRTESLRFDVARRRKGRKADDLGGFVQAVSDLPAAVIDIPAERAKNAARAEQRQAAAALAAEQNRQARVALMNMEIAQHDREDAAWRAGIQKSAVDQLAAQRAAQEAAAQSPVRQPKGTEAQQRLGNELYRMAKEGGVRMVTPGAGSVVIDMAGEANPGLLRQQANRGGNTRGKYPGAWNNPGNVRPGAVDYAGQTGVAVSKKGSGRFLTFDTPQSGLNSMSNVIGQIVRVKIPDRFAKGELASDKFTARNLVSVYAPSSENDTSEYVDFVSKRLGVKPDDELSVSDAATMAKLIDTMVRRESGHAHANWFTPEEYRAAAELMNGGQK